MYQVHQLCCVTAGRKSRIESEYSPEKDREQDADYKHSAFTLIGSIADCTKNTECLKFQVFCRFSAALRTLIFTFVCWEVLCKLLSWTKEHLHPHSRGTADEWVNFWKSPTPNPCSKKGHLGPPLWQTLNAILWSRWCKTAPPDPLLQAAPVSPQSVVNLV